MIALVTGGTGTLGQVLVPMLLEEYSRVRVLSRDEHKQTAMHETLKDDRIDYFVGDVRDKDRLWYACKGVTSVFHLAAVKSVDKAEYNPNEAVETNVIGSRNVIDACIKQGVVKAIITSTDKAVEPLNVYGATKLTAEKLFVQSNSYAGENGTVFGAVRYGNVMGSNGSVIPKWKAAVGVGNDPYMTDPSMTRFWISKDEAAKFVYKSFNEMGRGEIRIPKMKACFMNELYSAFCEASGFEKTPKIIGVRPGEKRDERLFGVEEVPLVTDNGDCWIKWPSMPNFPIDIKGEQVKAHISSRDAVAFSRDELVGMIRGVL